MAAITFVLLAHERSDDVADAADTLLAGDPTCRIVLHYDLGSPRSQYEKLRARYRNEERLFFVEKRVACGWGRFGLVKATVQALRFIRGASWAGGHVYLLSGSCMPVRPLAELHAFLDQQPDAEFIESETADWITGGLKEERLRFWFPFGIKSHPRLFNALTGLQRKLGIRRRFPAGLTPRFGSQWWCLTWKTCVKILEWIEKHPVRYRYFKSIWIPDECFFQTLVWKFARRNIRSRTLTFYRFNAYGKPLILHDGHEAFAASLPYFFARKISPRGLRLRAALRTGAAGPAGATPVLDAAARHRLSYENLFGNEQDGVRPGQLFHPAQIFKAWPGILSDLPHSFAVLFGPPALTRIAANVLRGQPGLSVMGRLLKPGEVDFGPNAQAFLPLQSRDAGIRDMDPALYLSRALGRAPHFPLFELSYCDAPELARSLFKLQNAIVLPVLPFSSQAAYASLFWLLSLSEEGGKEAAAAPLPLASVRNRQSILEKRLDAAFTAKAMDALNRNLFRQGPSCDTAFIAPIAEGTAFPLNRSFLEFRHGPSSVCLAEAIDFLDREMAQRQPEELELYLPPAWREHFWPILHPHGRSRP